MSKTRLVTLGRVVRPHGLKGEFRIESYADSPFVFEGLHRIFLQKTGKRPGRFGIESWRIGPKGVLLKLEGIFGPEEIENWRGSMVQARYADLPMADSDAIYYEDLIGRQVFLPGGRFLGTIESVRDNAGQEVWTIRHSQGGEILFPASEQFVVRCEKEDADVVIDPPPGLLDIYLDSVPQP
ncbi:MAG: ribosome maturation factor RimM [Desulfovibrionales bacterium]